ncbi:hypothetical protein ABPG75_011088 [Micractinium tetrahymenae]
MPPRGKRPPPPKTGGTSGVALAALTLAALVLGAASIFFLHGGGGGSGSAAVQQEEAQAAAAALTPEETAARFVADLLKQHRVMIFSKSYCPYSMRGKDVMRRLAVSEAVHVLELDQLEAGQPEMGLVQDELARITGARTVPRIFVDGQFIGGADDVTAKEQSGELAALLTGRGLLRQA